MKKKNKILIILIIILLCSITGIYFLDKNNQKESNPFEIIVNSSELLTESTEGYDSVRIYQQKDQLIVNAESEAAFFDGAQFTIPIKKEIDPSAVEIIWTTISGGTEETEENDRVIAEIKIKEDGELIFDRKINFLQKATETIKDILAEKTKSKGEK